MRYCWLRLSAAVLAIGTIPGVSHPAGPEVCLGPDAKSELVAANVREMMHVGPKDSAIAAYIVSVGLVEVSDSAIVLVQDSSICHRALTAYLKHDSLETVKPRAVYVLRSGPRYLVTDTLSAGEFTGLHYVFDTAFVYKNRYFYKCVRKPRVKAATLCARYPQFVQM